MDISSSWSLCFLITALLLKDVFTASLRDQNFHSTILTKVESRGDSHRSHHSIPLYPQKSLIDGENGTEYKNHYFYFKFTAFDHIFYLNLTESTEWIAGEILVEYVRKNGSVSQQTPQARSGCHFVGHVHKGGDEVQDDEGGNNRLGEVVQGSWAALSGCNSQLHGVVATDEDYFYLEPVAASLSSFPSEEGKFHHIIKRGSRAENAPQECGTKMGGQGGEGRGKRNWRGHKRNKRLMTSQEYFLETVVVTDRSMLDYHQYRDLEAYVFTLMNIVAHIYRDASLGHLLRVVLLRVIILDTDQADILIATSPVDPLRQFCGWMERYNEAQGLHHDIAVLLTRADICEAESSSCNVLGLADIGSVCKKGRSCNINKENGLSTAFTIAHEMGHNLGLHHDGTDQTCQSSHKFIMAPSATESTNPHIWSECSRRQLTTFLDSTTQSKCLLNQPPDGVQVFNGSLLLPGLQYTSTEQCQLMLGKNATYCLGSLNECAILRCRPQSHSNCIDLVSPLATGTECRLPSGISMGVCYQGTCMPYSVVASPVDGGWSHWKEWTNCSLSCGTGLQHRKRSCDLPIPRFGGHYCVGKRVEYRTCNVRACPDGKNSRQRYCEMNPPSTHYKMWESVSLERVLSLGLDVCKSHCSPLDSDREVIYSSSLNILYDGTTCVTPQSKGVCISGSCKPISCNGTLWVESTRDECGVWCGDESSCVKVTGSFGDVKSPGDYRYYLALKLPRGSAHISISEVTPSSSNYIALKGEKSKNFINGRYRVLHAGHSPLTFAGSLWSYDRLSNGAESIKTEGQTNEKVEVYILAAEMYDGITFSFNLLNSKMHDIDAPVYLWRALDWGSCEGDSEQGHQERNVTCNEIDPELQVETQVSENYCRSLPKPISQQECSMESYYYSWVVSEWSQCNVSCGGIGIETRNVTCQRNITEKDGTNNVVMDDHICPRKQPRNIRTCNQGACQYKWNYGSWGSCDSVCGEGWMKREVWCVWREDTVVSPSLCRDENKPDNKVTCQSSAGNCSDYQWAVSEWNECQGDCNTQGNQFRKISCTHRNGTTVQSTFCSWEVPPITQQTCTPSCVSTPADPTPACTNIYSTSLCDAVFSLGGCAIYKTQCCLSCS